MLAGDRQKALSRRAAQNCENAAEPVCRCRCGGALHGAGRGRVEDLPVDDPHSLARICPKCRGDGKAFYFDAAVGESVEFKCPKCGGVGKILPRKKEAR